MDGLIALIADNQTERWGGSWAGANRSEQRDDIGAGANRSERQDGSWVGADKMFALRDLDGWIDRTELKIDSD